MKRGGVAVSAHIGITDLDVNRCAEALSHGFHPKESLKIASDLTACMYIH